MSVTKPDNEEQWVKLSYDQIIKAQGIDVRRQLFDLGKLLSASQLEDKINKAKGILTTVLPNTKYYAEEGAVFIHDENNAVNFNHI
jgi:hypothetical protein